MKLSTCTQKMLIRMALMALGAAKIIWLCSRMNLGLYVCMIMFGILFIAFQLLDVFVDKTRQRLQPNENSTKAKMVRWLAVAFGGMDNDL